MATRVAIVGDGAMAGLCAVLLSENGLSVRLWSAFPESAEQLRSTRRNHRFFPALALPRPVEVTCDPSEALVEADMAVSAVATQYTRWWWQQLRGSCPPNLPVCSVAKGIENDTLLRPTQIVLEAADGSIDSRRPVAALSGPCIAPEVARKLPATVTAACRDEGLARCVQRCFSRPYFRVYTNDDVVGTELAGATKNVIAIAAGILDGLSAGCNAKAALLTRGLVEITRLGVAMGGRAETFAGLAGMGDLVTTCFSPVGRNRSFGEAIGRGLTVEQAEQQASGVVEGVTTTAAVLELSRRHGVEMPITGAIHRVLFEGSSPAQAIAGLMSRPLRAER
jgi:glycerol-3-phosphate dehydrogenase (NAD(P)+)